jgi:hypothetical protein
MLNVALAAILGGIYFSSFSGEEKTGGFVKPTQAVKSLDLDKAYNFCGEPLPMDNFDVRQRLDQELLRNIYYHSATILSLERAGMYFPVIEPILAKEGVPNDLKYLAVAESSLSNAISPAGARGVWQFMKSAGTQYGLEITDEVDERYDLEKATRAACKYLRDQNRRLGSWTLAAAAYNGGPDRIGNEKSNQRANNFYEMNLAADETMRYVFRIVAIKEVMSHPADYEYNIDPSHIYKPLNNYRAVEVTSTIPNFGDYAVQNGTTYRMLKIYNPWLMDSKLTIRPGKKYTLRIPQN